MCFNKSLWELFGDVKTNSIVASERAQELCVEYLGSTWKGEGFQISKVTGGMNNHVFKCQMKDQTVLLRIQCQKDAMQLQNELAVFITLANHGLGPKLFGIFPGGRLEEFIPSRTLSPEETRTHGCSYHVAAAMARIHQVDVPQARKSTIVSTMRQWLQKIIRNGGTEFELWSKVAGVPKDKFPAKVTVSDLEKEILDVERFFERAQSPLHLTHNDLFGGNILLKDGSEIDDDGSVWKTTEDGRVETDETPLVLIDFEFGMYNYRGFDIGNYLNEMANAYFEEEPTYSILLPCLSDRELHRAYCEGYVKEIYKIKTGKGLEKLGLNGHLESDVDYLLKEAELFMPISNLWWALWNIICAQEGAKGCDFESNLRDRLCLYFHFKAF